MSYQEKDQKNKEIWKKTFIEEKTQMAHKYKKRCLLSLLIRGKTLNLPKDKNLKTRQGQVLVGTTIQNQWECKTIYYFRRQFCIS